MGDPVLLSLRRDQTDRLWQAAVLARARAYEAQAEAETCLAAYFAAQGARESAGEAGDRAAELRREAHLTLDMAHEPGPGGGKAA